MPETRTPENPGMPLRDPRDHPSLGPLPPDPIPPAPISPRSPTTQTPPSKPLPSRESPQRQAMRVRNPDSLKKGD
jgi:hypothetical protein